MIMPTAIEILDQLMQAKPRKTSEAPRDARGIYGLFDHTGAFRYVGSTSSAAENFYKRIHHRHRTGSESTSHYFSRMYNTGRMWRLRNDLASKSDGDISKALRNEFIARHCSCTWVELPDDADISGLEEQVIALAPPKMVAWNQRGMDVYDEPVALVDALIEELQLSPFERAAIGRQRNRHLGAAPAVRAKLETATGQIGIPPLPKGPFRFFALDVETANNDRGSICQVGVACVRPDDSIKTWVTLVDPRTENWQFSHLHGITNAMVQEAPTIDAVIDTLDGMLQDSTVYQHSGFDRSAIRAACDCLARTEPQWNWLNSVSTARAAWPELKNNGGHGLASLKSHLGLRFEHHDAGEDARAAAEVVLLAERCTPLKRLPQPEAVEDSVLDDSDFAMRNTSGSAIRPDADALPEVASASRLRTLISSRPRADSQAERSAVRVPVAADGTTFHPGLARRGYFTVGGKGAEEKHDSFDVALEALNRMDTPRWRRPNAAGNWGIVSGRLWKEVEKG